MGSKHCIHPAQVALAHGEFGATPAERERAHALLAAAAEAAGQGRGTFAYEGQMVDEPMLAAARALLAQGEGE